MVKQTMGNIQRSVISNQLIGMGDSHLDNFTFFCAATCRVPGATAYGLTNNQSETRAREAFLNFLFAFPGYVPLLCIGEVDCNSLPWKHGRTDLPESFIQQSIDHLFSFLAETGRQFILPSVTLPPVDSFRSTKTRPWVTANKEVRTNLVKLYNQRLREEVTKKGHSFLDIATPTTGLDGFVNQSFIQSTDDVHLSPEKIRDIVRIRLDGVRNG
jgi:hypothetical protein